MSAQILAADGPDSRLFACVDPAVQFTEAKVAGSRLGALLAPFPDEASARAALAAAGAVLSEPGRRK